MSRRSLFPNLTLASLALAGWAAVAPASADDAGTADFTVTLQPGWTLFSASQSNTHGITISKLGSLINPTGSLSLAVLSASPHDGGALSQAEITALMAANIPVADSLVISLQDSKTLGGRSFSYIELKKNTTDSAAATARYRIYFLTDGGLLFDAFTFYNLPDNGGAIADLEATLATLKLHAVATRIVSAGNARPEFRPADHDVLGRFDRADLRKTPLFRMPAL